LLIFRSFPFLETLPINAKTLSFLRVRVIFDLDHAQRITTTDEEKVFVVMR
jgi:hypothetical protein